MIAFKLNRNRFQPEATADSILKILLDIIRRLYLRDIFLKDALNHSNWKLMLNIPNMTINGDTLGHTSIKSESDIGGEYYSHRC
jgi:hypothetical protein